MDDELKKRLDPGYPKTGDRRKKIAIVTRESNGKIPERDPSQRVYIKPKKRVPKSLSRTYFELRNRRKKDKASSQTITKPSRSMMMDTTTSAYGDAGRGRPVPEFSKGGICRGAGAAIKGTKFEGVF